MQKDLDSKKNTDDRRSLGQFSTPFPLAKEIVTFGLTLLGGKGTRDVRFMDPAIGTGSFYSAVESACSDERCLSAIGYEIDPHYAMPAKELWRGHPIEIKISDFACEPPASFRPNLVVCNPPYVRHHLMHAERKKELALKATTETGVKISGLSGLYCYFMLLADKWLSEGAISGWLVPSEFMDVGYGKCLKDYLLHNVRLVRVHRFDPAEAQFDDALVSSAVVWFEKGRPDPDGDALFTYGGTHDSPAMSKRVKIAELETERKWTRFPAGECKKTDVAETLSDYFTVKRGIATGNNGFFILSESKMRGLKVPDEFSVPILPGPRALKADVVTADSDGNPELPERLFLLKCPKMAEEMGRLHPQLCEYLRSGEENVSKGCLCRSRKEWYSQEERRPAPILCSYMGRGSGEKGPFRFILNHSKAIATNSYLMLYPTKRLTEEFGDGMDVMRAAWEFLNKVSQAEISGEGRVYGGGLRKVEPRELQRVDVSGFASFAANRLESSVEQGGASTRIDASAEPISPR